MQVRKIFNKSEKDIVIESSIGNTITIKPKQTLRDIDVSNLENIRESVNITYNLNEIK